MKKATIKIPGLTNPISIERYIRPDKSYESYVNNFRSQEGIVGIIGASIVAIIVVAITSIIIAIGIGNKMHKERIKRIIKHMKPYIEKITQELKSTYVQYTEVISFLKKSKYIDKLKEIYGDVINISEDDELNISENEFVKMIMNDISEDILSIIRKEKSMFREPLKFSTWHGGFDIYKVEDAIHEKYNITEVNDSSYEKYFSPLYSISGKLEKEISTKYKNFSYLFDMAGDDFSFNWAIEIKYKISKQLYKEILSAVDKEKKEEDKAK
jgi:hypothetical protein